SFIAAPFHGLQDRLNRLLDGCSLHTGTRRHFFECREKGSLSGSHNLHVRVRLTVRRAPRKDVRGTDARDSIDVRLRARSFVISSVTTAYFSFRLALLTTTRAVDCAMHSTSMRPCAFSVLPVSTRSTIRSARPTKGANSIEPYNLTISTGTPR